MLVALSGFQCEPLGVTSIVKRLYLGEQLVNPDRVLAKLLQEAVGFLPSLVF